MYRYSHTVLSALCYVFRSSAIRSKNIMDFQYFLDAPLRFIIIEKWLSWSLFIFLVLKIIFYVSVGVCTCVCTQSLSHVGLFATPWTVAHQAPLSVGFSSQEYWSGLPFLSPGICLIQGSNPHLLPLLYWQVDSLPLSYLGSPCVSIANPNFFKLVLTSYIFFQHFPLLFFTYLHLYTEILICFDVLAALYIVALVL